jgi:hypothetical protein
MAAIWCLLGLAILALLLALAVLIVRRPPIDPYHLRPGRLLRGCLAMLLLLIALGLGGLALLIAQT